MTEVPLSQVAPVFRSGGRLERDLARDCVRLSICEGVEGLRHLEASFLATDSTATGPQDRLRHLDGSTVDLGRTLEVALGPDAQQRRVFDGVVSAFELVLEDGAPPVVVVLAEDALMRLRMTRRSRTYTRMTDADIAREIAGEHGLQADVSGPGPRYDVVQQFNQSDLAFLRDRGRLLQTELWCTGQTLHFRPRTARSAPEVTLLMGAELLSVRLLADLAHQRSAVVVTGYDADQERLVDERADPGVVDGEVTSGRTGARLVERALGASTTLRVREVALNAEEAQAWARAEMLRRGRRFVTVTGTTNGTPDLVVGSRLRLVLVGQPFEGGGYYVTRVRHTFDLRRGFRTCFEAERATLNRGA